MLLSTPVLPQNGSLSSTPIIVEGDVARGRFGSSLTNLGDVDNDGYEGECLWVCKTSFYQLETKMCVIKHSRENQVGEN